MSDADVQRTLGQHAARLAALESVVGARLQSLEDKIDALRLTDATEGGVRLERKRLGGAALLLLGATAGAIDMLVQVMRWLGGKH